MSTMGVNLLVCSSGASALSARKPARLVAFSLNSWIHWLSMEKVSLPLLRLCV